MTAQLHWWRCGRTNDHSKERPDGDVNLSPAKCLVQPTMVIWGRLKG